MIKNCTFSIFVKYPNNCKITINDKEISKISVPKGTLIHWKIEKEGYKIEKGEIKIYSDLEYVLSLQLKQPKSLDPSTEFYTKILQDEKGNYKVQLIPIDESSIPPIENHDKEFLSNENGNLVWKKFISPTENDINKYVTWSGSDFVFKSPLPDLPDESSDYVLHHIGGNLEWIHSEQKTANWGNIQGFISDQEDLCEILTDFQDNLNNVQNWTSSFTVDENCFKFENSILSMNESYISPIKLEIKEINYSISDLQKRHILFEKASDIKFNQRATAPDYSQIESLPKLDRNNMFTISKHYWAIIESSNLNDELKVYDAIRSVDGKPLEPLTDKYLATIYRNSSSIGKDLKYIILTKSYYYQLSNPDTMHITLVGEIPYGETP